MYTALIVDDEPLMRKFFENNLTSICADFCVTGIACDGLEAVELLKKQSFDLVITDINMPEMNGINLAKYIFESSINTKVIIISGYNEFEYARAAIKYGVSDYILKPLSDKDISDTLLKIKEKLDKEKAVIDPFVPLPAYDNLPLPELKSALLSAIISGNNNSIHYLYDLMQKRHMTFSDSYFLVMLLCIDDLHLFLQKESSTKKGFYSFELKQQCISFSDSHDYAATCADHDYSILLLNAKSEEEIVAMAASVYKEITTGYWSYDKIKIIASYGYITKDVLSLAASYSSAKKSLALDLINIPSPISFKHLINQQKFINELTTICNALCLDYISKNINKTSSDLLLYIGLFQNNISLASILKFGTYLIQYLAKRCNIKPEFTESAFKELTNNADECIITKNYDKKCIHFIFTKVLKALDDEEVFIIVPETARIVESAKEFICTHYQDQISLTLIADSLNVNPSYLSDLFHKITGETYSKFLTRIRMEQALLLLRSNPNEKVYIISEKVGFVSVKHFNSVFKKFYGLTPTEFILKNI